MIELKVGEEIRIRCIEDFTRIPECTKCCFYQQCNAIVTHCQSFARTDGKNVHYEVVEKIKEE